MQVHRGAQVVDVGHEDVLLALGDELVQQARVVEAGVDVAVARRVPGLRVLPRQAQVGGDGQKGLFVDARVSGGEINPSQCLYTLIYVLHTLHYITLVCVCMGV